MDCVSMRLGLSHDCSDRRTDGQMEGAVEGAKHNEERHSNVAQ